MGPRPTGTGGTLEHDPLSWGRIMLSIPCIGRIFCGEPVPTSPENAPRPSCLRLPRQRLAGLLVEQVQPARIEAERQPVAGCHRDVLVDAQHELDVTET